MSGFKPEWLVRAETFLGTKEVPGAANNPIIVGWLITLNAWWRNDLEPWCGTFLGQVFRTCDIDIPKAWYRARAWLDWGEALDAPAYGCIVVFTRVGGGHVGIVVGKDAKGRLMVLGGNQGDAVSIAPFDIQRVAGYRWPKTSQRPRYGLPLLAANGKSSVNEA